MPERVWTVRSIVDCAFSILSVLESDSRSRFSTSFKLSLKMAILFFATAPAATTLTATPPRVRSNLMSTKGEPSI